MKDEEVTILRALKAIVSYFEEKATTNTTGEEEMKTSLMKEKSFQQYMTINEE